LRCTSAPILLLDVGSAKLERGNLESGGVAGNRGRLKDRDREGAAAPPWGWTLPLGVGDAGAGGGHGWVSCGGHVV